MQLPALVAPEGELSREEINRYSRHLLIPDIGLTGQKRLKNAKVLVIGAGGLGAPTLLYLAAAGRGTLGIIDFDRVDESNLQRQIIHGVDTLGELKVDSAEQAIARLNPHVRVEKHRDRLTPEIALDLFSEYDLIVDGTDNFATRYLVNDACVLTGRPYVWGSIFRFEGQVSVFWEHAPGGCGLNYRDLYAEPPPPDMAPSCAEGGVLGVLCASIASIMATEAIKLITGIGDILLGRLVMFDALDMRYRELPIQRLPGRLPVTNLTDYEEFCQAGTGITTEDVGQNSISALELKALMESDQRPVIVDVREQGEWDIVHLPGSRHIVRSPSVASEIVEEFGVDSDLVIVCRSGVRSRAVVRDLIKHGARRVRELSGGILAWIKDVDPSLPSY